MMLLSPVCLEISRNTGLLFPLSLFCDVVGYKMDTETFIIEIVIDFTLSAYKRILLTIREMVGTLFGG